MRPASILEILWPRWAMEPLRLARMPMFAAAACFAAGIALARWNWVPVGCLVWLLVVCVVLTLAALRRALRCALLPSLLLWFIAGMLCMELEPLPLRQQAVVHGADHLRRQISGSIVRVQPLTAEAYEPATIDPETLADDATPQQNLVAIDLALDHVEEVTPDLSRMMPVEGGIRLYVRGRDASVLPSLRCGDALTLAVQMREPERYLDAGVWQFADYLEQQGIAATARVDAAVLHPSPGKGRFSCRVHAWSTWAAGRLQCVVDSRANRMLPAALRLTRDDAGMLSAMLFGDRTLLDHGLRLGFERTGTFHVFVVAGMHLGLLAAMVYMLLPRRLPEGLRVLLTLALATLYALLTGFQPPVQRALLMTGVFLLTRWLARNHSTLNALGVAAIVVMASAPHLLFEASLQMSLLVIVAIGGIAAPLLNRTVQPYLRAASRLRFVQLDTGFPPHLAQFRVLLRMYGRPLGWIFGRSIGRWARSLPAWCVRVVLHVVELAFVSLIAELVMALPMAIYFHRLTLLSVPLNLLCVPLLGVLMPVAIVTFVVSLLWPWLAMLPAAATALLLHAMTSLAQRASYAPAADLRIPPPPVLAIVFAMLVWAACLWLVRTRDRWVWTVVALLPLAMLAVTYPYARHIHPGQLEVTAIDVGQGDSIFVTSPEGQTMLIDAGGPVGSAQTAAASKWDVGEDVISPYLWSRGIRRLNIVVLTHAHSDHMGGMAAVLRNFHPQELWISVDAGSSAFRALLDQVRQQGIVVRRLRAPCLFAWSRVNLRILAPQQNVPNGFAPVNNDSLVMEIDYGQSSVLLEGDAEQQSEATMLASEPLHPVTLLKVGHHGSLTSTTPAWLAALHPHYAVISAGRNNRFGHPRMEVLQRLQMQQVRTWRTDLLGVSTFLLSEDGSVTTD
ncbi:DNA internalization-related competence protein ComEC/Rec2 [Terriglobus tenax]|uniref:DNA internalization-related competence protein ComEC/Rec2 n=1 Tax=Terriglobus tenax TaxID=1111115 RepID=UPI0021DF44CA|nr:DNA internalization-related competence protein ComEC/Rec2 [Terriglobus tenax]